VGYVVGAFEVRLFPGVVEPVLLVGNGGGFGAGYGSKGTGRLAGVGCWGGVVVALGWGLLGWGMGCGFVVALGGIRQGLSGLQRKKRDRRGH